MHGKMNQNGKSKAEMLKDISMIDFVIVEMTLYLDTHPHEKQAIDYVNYYIRKKNQMLTQYSLLYGPLTVSSVQPGGNEWTWALEPMPWEGGCQ